MTEMTRNCRTARSRRCLPSGGRRPPGPHSRIRPAPSKGERRGEGEGEGKGGAGHTHNGRCACVSTEKKHGAPASKAAASRGTRASAARRRRASAASPAPPPRVSLQVRPSRRRPPATPPAEQHVEIGRDQPRLAEAAPPRRLLSPRHAACQGACALPLRLATAVLAADLGGGGEADAVHHLRSLVRALRARAQPVRQPLSPLPCARRCGAL